MTSEILGGGKDVLSMDAATAEFAKFSPVNVEEVSSLVEVALRSEDFRVTVKEADIKNQVVKKYLPPPAEPDKNDIEGQIRDRKGPWWFDHRLGEDD